MESGLDGSCIVEFNNPTGEDKMHILMCGPIANTGGVSTHTTNLIKLLIKNGLFVSGFNLSGLSLESGEQTTVIKLYQRTIGLFIQIIRKRNSIDIVHIQASGGIFAFIPAIVGSLTSRILKKPNIITFHYSQTANFVKKYKEIFRFALKCCDKLILVSPGQERVIIDYFPQYRSKVTVIGNGYNPDVYYPLNKVKCRSELGIPLDKYVLFNISNLTPTKGHKYLIKACSQLQMERDDFLCYIAGRGEMKEELLQQIKRSQSEKKIKLIGYLKEEDVKKWISASDLFVFPSLAESFGIVIIEALACGLPVIATINGGSESIVINENIGFLCPRENSNCLKEKIVKGLEKKWDRSIILNTAKTYTWNNIATKTKDIYKSFLN